MDNEFGRKEEELDDILKNKFQKLEPQESLPEDLKKEVFDTLDSFDLMADFLDLFTVKFAASEFELMDAIIPENKNKEEE